MKTLVVIFLVFTGTANAQWRAAECKPVQQHYKGGVTVQKHYHTYHHRVEHWHYPVHKYHHVHHWAAPQCFHFHAPSCPPANPCDCQHSTYTQRRQYILNKPHHRQWKNRQHRKHRQYKKEHQNMIRKLQHGVKAGEDDNYQRQSQDIFIPYHPPVPNTPVPQHPSGRY